MNEGKAGGRESEPTLPLGTVVSSHYKVLRSLGAGAMGTVFLAHDELLGRNVTIKLIVPPPGAGQEWRRRFRWEAAVVAGIAHPHVLPTYSVTEGPGGTLVMVGPYVNGTDLATVLSNEGSLAITRVAEIISAVASALDEVHRVGIVHNDVNPANILLDWRNHVFLAGFGLAREIDVRQSGAAEAVGAVGYIAPERFLGHSADGQVDQYALGAVAFTLLTGHEPFRRETPPGVMAAQLYEPLPQATSLRPGLPTAVDAVLARALAKRGADRFASAGEFAEALRMALVRDPQPHPEGVARMQVPTPNSLQPSDRGAARQKQAAHQRSLVQAFTDGVGGVLGVCSGIRRRRRSLPAFEDMIVEDAQELCRELGLVIQEANGQEKRTSS